MMMMLDYLGDSYTSCWLISVRCELTFLATRRLYLRRS